MSEQRVFPFLMFTGNADAAMAFYASVFDQFKVLSVTRYGPGQDGREGTVMHATFSVLGHALMCIDSSVEHAFTFTPSVSLYVRCAGEAELDRYFDRLEAGGMVLMPLAAYPFARKYAWVQDRFGVSWQLSLDGM